MSEEICVGLHCHSNLSDGSLTPEQLAELVASHGARYAALTDHDTVAGSRRFRQALSRLGVGCVDAAEITTASPWGEIHLLAYGVRVDDENLLALLEATRRRTDPGVQGLVDSLRRFGSRADPPHPQTAGPAEVIAAIHAAGGAAFLAHPLSYAFDAGSLEPIIAELAAAGLDGLEAIYPGYAPQNVERLLDLGRKYALAISAGSDYHGPGMAGPVSPCVTMDRQRWEALRDHILRVAPQGRGGGDGAPIPLPVASRVRLGGSAARVIFPAVLAIVLFLVTIFAVLIPSFERVLMEKKKDLIHELTNSAVSVLAEFAADERAGSLTREQAQSAAAARIRDLRYGKEGKDYFWITDTHPTMIVHPYRRELEGTDVSGYMDANGVRVFVEFIKAVREKDEGYVEYLWQWKDDAHRIVPKLSFVKRFAPWDWVVGTGVYLDDVNSEITGIAGRFIGLEAAVSVVLSLLLVFIAHQSLAAERRRRVAESSLRESHEKYRALVEASTEGMLIVVGGACTYANRTLQDMLGFTEAEISLLGVADLIRAREGDDAARRAFLDSLSGDPARSAAPAGEFPLAGRDGRTVDALLTASRFDVAGRDSAIITVKDLAARRRAEAAADSVGLSDALWKGVAIGIFRATWGRRAFLLACNPAAREILGLSGDTDITQVNLFSLLADQREGEKLYSDLSEGIALREREVRLQGLDRRERVVLLSAAVESDADSGETRCLDGVLQDVTELTRRRQRSEELMAELETSSLLLLDSVERYSTPAATCDMNTPIRTAAGRMSRTRQDALVVLTPAGDPVGIVTDRDMRERVVAAQLDPQRPVREIMSSPLVTTRQSSPVYEAILLMRERGIAHLAVKDPEGRVVAVTRGMDLLRMQRQSPAMIRQEIRAAGSVEDLTECRSRVADLVRGLVAGGARPRSAVRVFSMASDLIVERLVDFAVRELGDPPAAFAFVAIGSEGRREQTPASDQDNAIVYADAADAEKARRYFVSLGESVCRRLNEVGVPYCQGGIMAMNPEWCVPLEKWRGYFARWIREPEPEQVLRFNIFFDLRCTTGNGELVEALLRTARDLVAATPSFLLHLAQDSLGKRVPANRKAGDIDLKEAMSLVVNFARVYSLRHGVDATNTLERLDDLRDARVLSRSSHANITQAYELLMRLRLGLDSLTHRAAVDPASLPRDQQALLRDAVAELPVLQKKMAFDFLGQAL